jgi:hypothetical protein
VARKRPFVDATPARLDKEEATLPTTARCRTTELASRLREILLAGRNADGGWGYYPGKASRLEPTCWTLLSLLQDGGPEDAAVVDEGLRLLARWQRADGLIAEPLLPPNLAFNGLASLVFASIGPSVSSVRAAANSHDRLLAAIVATEPLTVGRLALLLRPANPQDDSLVGWSWTPGAYAWVEPTALCLTALKRRTGPRAERVQWRIEQAEKMLFNRQCQSGGWNAGNAESLGQPLRAYVPTTALAVLALQDRGESTSVKRAERYLIEGWRREPTGMALALTVVALHALRLPTDDLALALADAGARTGMVMNQAVIGMVRYALMIGAHGRNVFAL